MEKCELPFITTGPRVMQKQKQKQSGGAVIIIINV